MKGVDSLPLNRVRAGVEARLADPVISDFWSVAGICSPLRRQRSLLHEPFQVLDDLSYFLTTHWHLPHVAVTFDMLTASLAPVRDPGEGEGIGTNRTTTPSLTRPSSK